MLTPDAYLRNTARLFGPSALIMLVLPGKDGNITTHVDGLEGVEPITALETVAAAQAALERQTAAVVGAVAQATGQTQEAVLELVRDMSSKHHDAMEANAASEQADMSAEAKRISDNNDLRDAVNGKPAGYTAMTGGRG